MTDQKSNPACRSAKDPPSFTGEVVAVASDRDYGFSKRRREMITLVAGHGVEGDAHAGPYVRHRHLARRRPHLPNLRQVHIIAHELFDALAKLGYQISPGDLGENITTAGLKLECLPLGTLLHMGSTASIELTGLRTPCVLIDRFKKGLKQHMINNENEPRYRCGVLAVVRSTGSVSAGDPVRVSLPGELRSLPAL